MEYDHGEVVISSSGELLDNASNRMSNKAKSLAYLRDMIRKQIMEEGDKIILDILNSSNNVT